MPTYTIGYSGNSEGISSFTNLSPVLAQTLEADFAYSNFHPHEIIRSYYAFKIRVVCDVMPCGLVNSYRRCEGA